MYERIASLCKTNGLSIAGLEKELGFGNGTINRWGKGTSPTVEKLQAVAEFFGCTVEWLIRG